jgi:hypothetical protein
MGAAPTAMVVPMMVVPAATYADTLDCLVKVPGLYVKERLNLLEILTGFETENTFDVALWNPAAGPPDQPEIGRGAPAFVMKEVSDCCQRQFCGPRRAFSIAMVPATPMIATFHPQLESRASVAAARSGSRARTGAPRTPPRHPSCARAHALAPRAGRCFRTRTR